MQRQGALAFEYEKELSAERLTSLAGLPLYLDLILVSGMAAAVHRHVHAAGEQGWMDIQMVIALIFLNLSGGDCMSDLDRLEHDAGFAAILLSIERCLFSPARAPRAGGAVAAHAGACGAVAGRGGGMAGRFHDPDAPKAEAGHASIPAVTEELQGLWLVNQVLLEFMQTHNPSDGGDAGHGRDADRDAQARRAVLLQEVQGVSAAELLVGGTGHDALFGVPGRQRPGRT